MRNDLGDRETDYHLKDGTPPLDPLHVNLADKADLMSIDGIGEKKAKGFIAAREARSAAITTNAIFDGLELDGKPVFTEAMRKKIRKQRRLSFKT